MQTTLLPRLLRVTVATVLLAGQILAASDLQIPGGTVGLLIRKARSLEGRDRYDLAAQVWHQVLITDPNQVDALGALARWAKRNGRNDDAATYLTRLRSVAPQSPLLNQLDTVDSAKRKSVEAQLREASNLAAAHRFDEALRLYKSALGSNSPTGDWAIAYYETLASTQGGLVVAVDALKKLMLQNPSVPEYRLAVGKLMTYEPATRPAGVKLLMSVSGSTTAVSEARDAWRQALLWEKANPSYAPEFREFLSRYPDSELEQLERQLPKFEPQKPGSKEEQLAYRSLQQGDLAKSQSLFELALSKDATDWRAHAGLGYTSMKSNDFETAVRELEVARKSAPQDATVRTSLEAARFWLAMQSGAKSLDVENWQEAVDKYRDAVALRPEDGAALRALGGALLAARSPREAIPVLTKATRVQASDATAWCALLQATLEADGAHPALTMIQQVPASVAETLSRDVQWKALTTSAYADAGQIEKASKLYHELLTTAPASLSVDTQVRLASLALRFHAPDRALTYARQAVDSNPNRASSWQVFFSALIAAGQQSEVASAFGRMPAAVKDALTTKPEYESTLASIKQAEGDLEGARVLLADMISRAERSDRPEELEATRIQLADVLSKLGQTEEAETILSAITETHPEDIEAWRARLLLLQQMKRSSEIVSLVSSMPQGVAMRLGMQGDMVNLLASAHAATGDSRFGIKLLETYIAHSESGSSVTGTAVDLAENRVPQLIQLGWLLIDSPREAAKLYSVLTQLDSRRDLTPDQQKEVTAVWVNWILKSAETARKVGDEQRALALLEQGAKMFPENAELQGGFAGNLMAQHNTRRALIIYANWELKGAKPDDYAGAIGAALTEHNMPYADAWLQRGLAMWPRDAKLLALAGDRAQSRKDLKMAESFWKQALAESRVRPPQTAAPDEPVSGPGLRSLLLGPEAVEGAAHSDDSSSQPVRFASLVTTAAADASSPAPSPSGFTSGIAPLLQAQSKVSSDSDLLADKIAAVESRNTPYLDSRMTVWGRDGEDGFGKMTVQQAQFEASTSLGDTLRGSFIVEPTYVSGGTASGTGTSLFGRQTSAASFGPQSSGGLGVETQLASQSFGLDLGATPEGFLTHSWLGGIRITPANGPVTILLERDNVRDTMLSYSGGRDPQSGQIWGGVMSNSGILQVQHGTADSGIYANGGYQVLTGRNVARNEAEVGNAGAWWKLYSQRTGDLTLGMNFSAMHYDRNLRYFTFGQGGYFSPQQYFLFNVPVRWTGMYGKRLKYVIGGSVGSQHFSEDASDYYPVDAALQGEQNKQYPAFSNTGANFSFDGRISYQLAPHWMLGGFVTATNARDYTAASAGVFMKFLFDERPMDLNLAVPTVPDWKGQSPILPF